MLAANITTILFDAGGTLIFPNFHRIADELGADGLAVDPIALARADAAVRFEMDKPNLISATTDADRLRLYFDALVGKVAHCLMPDAVSARLQAYHKGHNLWETVPSDVPLALKELQRRFRLGVVSNANGTVRAKLAHLGLGNFFEIVIDSHEEGFEKPDPRLFEVALNRMSVDAGETAYIGDLYCVDVVGAVAAGLRAFLLDPLGLYIERSVDRVGTLGELAEVLRAPS